MEEFGSVFMDGLCFVFGSLTITVFTCVICALFSSLAAEKSEWVKYADFIVEVLTWVLF
jgi:hypothetical protein